MRYCAYSGCTDKRTTRFTCPRHINALVATPKTAEVVTPDHIGYYLLGALTG